MQAEGWADSRWCGCCVCTSVYVKIQMESRQHTQTHTLLRVKILNASSNMFTSILPNIEHSIYLVSDSISCVSHGWIGSDSSGKHGCDLFISSSMCLYLVIFSLPLHLICQSISLSNLVSEWLECPSLPLSPLFESGADESPPIAWNYYFRAPAQLGPLS